MMRRLRRLANRRRSRVGSGILKTKCQTLLVLVKSASTCWQCLPKRSKGMFQYLKSNNLLLFVCFLSKMSLYKQPQGNQKVSEYSWQSVWTFWLNPKIRVVLIAASSWIDSTKNPIYLQIDPGIAKLLYCWTFFERSLGEKLNVSCMYRYSPCKRIRSILDWKAIRVPAVSLKAEDLNISIFDGRSWTHT